MTKMSPDLLHQFYGLMTTQVCCLDSNWDKDVRVLKFLLVLFRGLVVWCLLGCRTLLNWNVWRHRLGIWG